MSLATSLPVFDDPRRTWTPRGAARAVWRDRRDECVLSGPAGTGKSRAILEKLHAICLQWPGARCLIVRKTRSSLTQSALVTFEAKVLPKGDAVRQGPTRAHRESYHYSNGSEIVVGGMDKPDKVMSTEYDFIYVQEAIELSVDEWEALVTRLRNGVVPFQQIVADTNPSSPQHWLYQRCQAGVTHMLDSRHEDNPVLWDADKGAWTEKGQTYLAKLDNLTGVRKERLRHGRWVQAEGVVYEGWNPAIHLIDRFDVPADWRRIRSIDFGFTNPFVCQWWAVDPDGRMYLDREIYMTGRTVRSHADLIKALTDGQRIEASAADHDAEDRATLLENGIKTIPANKAITVGLQKVAERLALAGDGKPRLFVLRDGLVERDPVCVDRKEPASTVEEFDSYIWPVGTNGKSLKEVPLDKFNHGMDALRYAVMYLDVGRVVGRIL